MDNCTKCEGSGFESKQTWEEPAVFCEDCNGTGDWVVQECNRLILEVDRILGKTTPKLAAEIIEALEERIKERS